MIRTRHGLLKNRTVRYGGADGYQPLRGFRPGKVAASVAADAAPPFAAALRRPGGIRAGGRKRA